MSAEQFEYCSHCKGVEHASARHPINLGGGRVLLVCEMCWQNIRAMVYDGIVKQIAKELKIKPD